MKVLEVNRVNLEFVGMLQKDESFAAKIRKRLANLIILPGLMFVLGASPMMYIYHNPTDISGDLAAFLNILGGVPCAGSFMGMIINEQNTQKLFHELQTIVDSGEFNT